MIVLKPCYLIPLSPVFPTFDNSVSFLYHYGMSLANYYGTLMGLVEMRRMPTDCSCKRRLTTTALAEFVFDMSRSRKFTLLHRATICSSKDDN